MKSWWRKGLFLGALGLLFLTGCSSKFPVLDPVGPVGKEELHLIILSTILVAIVIIPVIALLFFIVYRYRDTPGNKAPYTPEWSESKWLEIIWWGIPVIIIGILSVITVKETFALTKPPANSGEPITIQVTSLDWKWMFTYPDQNIATVNYVEIPAGRPVQFVLTSDAPINSFWVPALGGQEYTMPGMALRLWLQADETGTFIGKGANFSGKGFEHMSFKVISKSEANFNKWVSKVKKTEPAMTNQDYANLTKQGITTPTTYSSYPKGLYTDIVMKNGGKYMPNMWYMKEHKDSKK
jgi:cytochrome aa3-600 menaquinol oxidase subunit II